MAAPSTSCVEAAHELVVYRLVHDHRAERGAALARGAEAAEQRALGGQVELGVRHHHERVLAAELEAGRLHMAPAQLADPRAHGRRAGEAHLVDELLVERALEPGEGAGPVALHDVEHALREPAVDEQPGQRVAQRGRVLRRLPDDRVAAQQGRHEVPGRNGHGEVAGGDDRRHPHRVAEGEELLVGHLARHGLAVEPPPLAQEEVAGVDDLLHLAQRLRIGLADLARDEPGERLLVVLHEAADRLDRLAAHGRRHGGPLALGRRAPPGTRR